MLAHLMGAGGRGRWLLTAHHSSPRHRGGPPAGFGFDVTQGVALITLFTSLQVTPTVRSQQELSDSLFPGKTEYINVMLTTIFNVPLANVTNTCHYLQVAKTTGA